MWKDYLSQEKMGVICRMIIPALILTSIQAASAETPGSPPVAASVAAPLIPRTVLFGNPDKAAAHLSPDGSKISFLAPDEGVLNVWVAPADNPDAAKVVTHDRLRGIRMYFWAYTNRHIIYLQDVNGNENWHAYLVDLDKNEARDLAPIEGVRVEIQEVSYKFPDEILIGLNNRNPEFHDIYRVNLTTGDRALVQENPGFSGFMTDDDYHIRFASKMTPDGGTQLLKPAEGGKWEPYITIGMDDALTTHPIDFDKDGKTLYLIDSRGRNTAALKTLALDSNEEKLVAEDPKADISGIMLHPTEKTVQGVSFTYERKHYKFMDPAVAADFDVLGKVADGDIEVTSRTLDDQHWTVAFVEDNGPVRYYLYDRKAKKAKFLFTNRKDLEGKPLVRMHPEILKSRDDLDLVSYLSLPLNSDAQKAGRPDKPLPVIMLVHGGPWARSGWGYDPEHQWLANRGYAVLDVNYRGSTGFGKNFINAGNKEWGAKMHDDILDAMKWAIDQKIADPAHVAIMGGSYGGYEALVGVTFTPDTFACGVSIVGPSNLITLIKSIPPYWKPDIALFETRVGNPDTPDGQAFLKERSPLTFADKIKRPLLIGQGANDPRVKQAESDQIVAACKKKDIPVTYVVYPDEGHGFARPENRLSFNAVTEAFLAEHLGGRFQPIGEDFDGSTITVAAGKNQVPGLEQALAHLAKASDKK